MKNRLFPVLVLAVAAVAVLLGAALVGGALVGAAPSSAQIKLQRFERDVLSIETADATDSRSSWR